MELTTTQLQHIDVMRHKASHSLAQHRAWIASNYKDSAFYWAEDRLEEGVKAAFKAIINEWLEANNLTAHIRSELRVRHRTYPDYTEHEIQLGATSIYNSVGSLPDGKVRWMNKITVTAYRKQVRLRKHVVRTDPAFLEPTASEFLALMEAVHSALYS